MTEAQYSLLYSKASNIVIKELWAQGVDLPTALKYQETYDKIDRVYANLLLKVGKEMAEARDRKLQN